MHCYRLVKIRAKVLRGVSTLSIGLNKAAVKVSGQTPLASAN